MSLSCVETRFIASQNDVSPYQQLQAIDSLMWRQPDSALVVLVDFAASPQADSLSTFDRHYCQVLISELLFKNYCEQTNRTELLQAVDYFDSLYCRDVACRVSTQDNDIAFLTARTHYINGVGFYEQGDVVNACEEYLKAVEVMEERFGEKELVGLKARFKGLLFNRLLALFSDQYMPEPALNCAQEALALFHKVPLSAYSVPSTLHWIGKQYAEMDKIDSAECYYSQALVLMPDTVNPYYRDLCSSIALENYLCHQQTTIALRTLKRMAAEADDEDERLTRYFTIGDIYYREGLNDSALRYLQPVFDNKADLGIRLEIADHLSKIYGSLGEHEQEDAYIRFMAQHKGTDADYKSEASKLSTLFQDYVNRKQQRQAEAGQKSSQRMAAKRTLAVAVSVALLVLAVLVWVLRNRSKKRLAATETAAKQELEAERQTHRMEQAAMSGRLKRSNQELRELKEQMKQQDNSAAKAETAASFAEESICRLILERVKEGQFKSKVDYKIYEDSALDKQQLLELRLAADRHFNQFTVRLKKDFPKLTNGDLDYCCLYLLGLTDADIAALMQCSYNAVIGRNGKMKKIFGSENPLSVTLMCIADKFLPI